MPWDYTSLFKTFGPTFAYHLLCIDIICSLAFYVYATAFHFNFNSQNDMLSTVVACCSAELLYKNLESGVATGEG